MIFFRGDVLEVLQALTIFSGSKLFIPRVLAVFRDSVRLVLWIYCRTSSILGFNTVGILRTGSIMEFCIADTVSTGNASAICILLTAQTTARVLANTLNYRSPRYGLHRGHLCTVSHLG